MKNSVWLTTEMWEKSWRKAFSSFLSCWVSGHWWKGGWQLGQTDQWKGSPLPTVNTAETTDFQVKTKFRFLSKVFIPTPLNTGVPVKGERWKKHTKRPTLAATMPRKVVRQMWGEGKEKEEGGNTDLTGGLGVEDCRTRGRRWRGGIRKSNTGSWAYLLVQIF